MPKLVTLQEKYHKNAWSSHPVMVAEIDLTDSIDAPPGLFEDLIRLLPVRLPGVLYIAPDASVVEVLHWIVRSLQNYHDIAPPVSGVLVDEQERTATIHYAYGDPHFAPLPVRSAVALVHAAITGDVSGPQMLAGIDQVLHTCSAHALDQVTREMTREIDRRRIPWRREFGRFIDAGHGVTMRSFLESRVGDESWIAVSLSVNKLQSLQAFQQAGIPVGKFSVVSSPEHAVMAAQSIGYPLVIKPVDGGKGVDVWPGIANESALIPIARRFAAESRPMLLQSHFAGDGYRLLVVDGRFVAAARLIPASVVGDGDKSVAQLIEETNADPNRGRGFSRLRCVIELDESMNFLVADQGLNLSDIPAAGRRVWLKKTSNIHTGGTAEDVTDIIHPDNKFIAERASRKVGLRVAGVDFLTTDITRSWRETGGGICEINRSPGLRPHWNADPDRDVVGPIVDALFSDGSDGCIPTAMVTGSKGKTTTCLMLASILKSAGYSPGVASTDGVIVDGNWIHKGDVAGVPGAKMILSDPDVNAAVLETARGGIIKRGIYLKRCDVAAFLNVLQEQIGMDGVETLEDMAEVKRKVVDTADKAVVLNLDDPLTGALVCEFEPGRVIGFSMAENSSAVASLVKRGGAVVVLSGDATNETVVFVETGSRVPVVPISEIPNTMAGRHRGNVANALAATGLAHGMGVGLGEIANGLRACKMTQPGEPGRMIFLSEYPFEVLIDFSSNAPAIQAINTAIGEKRKNKLRICVFTAPGNRTDADYEARAAAAAAGFDKFICYENPREPRGKNAEKLRQGLVKVGVAPENATVVPKLDDALACARSRLGAGDFLAVLGMETTTLLDAFYRVFAKAVGRGGRRGVET